MTATDPITIWAPTSIHQTTLDRLADLIRAAGIAWKRENDPTWREKPWMDGILVDLDDAEHFIAQYVAERANPNEDGAA